MFENSNFPWIKFGILFIPLAFYILKFAPAYPGLNIWLWKILLLAAGVVGLFIALAGKTIGKNHGPKF